MSMVMCERCDRMIDSDDDPDCFVENPDAVLCEWCREEREAQQENSDDEAGIAFSERAGIF
jgi:hypothetical protein